MHAGTHARFEEGYRRIAETTKIAGWNDSTADILRIVRDWLSDESNGNWVMIIDNADDIDIFLPPAPKIQDAEDVTAPLLDFLPQSRNGSILITSRNRDVAFRLTGSHKNILGVRPMDKDEAATLLRKKLTFNNTDEQCAVELLQVLDYMPLAISQAAAFIEQRAPRMTISRYLDQVLESDEARARLLKMDIGDSRRDGKQSNSIMTTWYISFEHIKKDRPTASQLLSLMCFFDRQSIPDSLLLKGYKGFNGDSDDFEQDIHTLISHSLVGFTTEGTHFEMHRLVQFSTKKWLETHNELERWKQCFIKLINESYPCTAQLPSFKDWAICQTLLPHAQVAVECRPVDPKAQQAWASILAGVGRYARHVGNFDLAKDLLTTALQTTEIILGTDHINTLFCLEDLAIILHQQGDLRTAEQFARRALGGFERALGRDDFDTLYCRSTLSGILMDMDNFDDAEKILRQALESEKVALEKCKEKSQYGAKAIMNTHYKLAELFRRQAKLDKAEEMFQKILKEEELILEKNHPLTLQTRRHAAAVLINQGKIDAGVNMYQLELEARKEMQGPEHHDTLVATINLGSVLVRKRDYRRAELMLSYVLNSFEKRQKPESLATLCCMRSLAQALYEQYKLDAAEAMNRRAYAGTV